MMFNAEISKIQATLDAILAQLVLLNQKKETPNE